MPDETKDEAETTLAGPAQPASEVSWASLVPIVAVHGLAFALAPFFFSWPGLCVGIASAYVIAPLGINLGYHRLLTHRSLSVPKWLERTLVVIALLSLEGPPVQWVAIHRLHHRASDTNADPHSPIRGFFHAHCGWLFVSWRNQWLVTTYARDLLRDPFYRFLQGGLWWFGIYLAHVALFWAAALAYGWLAFHDLPRALTLAASVLVWGVLVRQLYVWHITWSINSLTHMFGYQSYATRDRSRNNWLLGLLAAGEGWHNNHHHDQASASNWHRFWEVDYTYALIRGLALLGLAHDIRLPRHARKRAHASFAGSDVGARGGDAS